MFSSSPILWPPVKAFIQPSIDQQINYMDSQRIAVSTSELSVGMYVAELDRPWLETPFLFQGFYIQSEKEISELQQYCQKVYVDIDRCDETALHNAATIWKSIGGLHDGFDSSKIKPAFSKKRVTDRNAEADEQERMMATIDLREEIVAAKVTHKNTIDAVNDIFAAVRNGTGVDLQVAKMAIEPMVVSIVKNEDALSWLVRMKKKDNYIHDHSIASCVWAMIFGKHLGLKNPDLQVLGLGALLMDVGKTRIPSEVLVKETALSGKESLLMQKHVEFGREIIRRVKGVDVRVIQIIEAHHERYNGTGYPRGLKANEIPVFARIASIVDAYDAMTTFRPYAQAISTNAAMQKISDLAGLEFQAEMVEQFIQAVGIFPVGTLVELSTGEVGVVIAQNRMRRLRPKVMLLTDPVKTPLQTFRTIDLRVQLVDGAGESLCIERGLPPGAHGLNPSEYYL
jgi:HD-GYP domain-containing protein (c-di-GMP phosphodiesterase class II)